MKIFNANGFFKKPIPPRFKPQLGVIVNTTKGQKVVSENEALRLLRKDPKKDKESIFEIIVKWLLEKLA